MAETMRRRLKTRDHGCRFKFGDWDFWIWKKGIELPVCQFKLKAKAFKIGLFEFAKAPQDAGSLSSCFF
jgi:hypothetical protein